VFEYLIECFEKLNNNILPLIKTCIPDLKTYSINNCFKIKENTYHGHNDPDQYIFIIKIIDDSKFIPKKQIFESICHIKFNGFLYTHVKGEIVLLFELDKCDVNNDTRLKNYFQ